MAQRRTQRTCYCTGCPACIEAALVTPHGSGLKAHKSMLTHPRDMKRWLRESSPYTGFKLWRLWTPPKPVKVETSEEILRRQLGGKPSVIARNLTIPYPWKLWHQHKDLRGTSRDPEYQKLRDSYKKVAA